MLQALYPIEVRLKLRISGKHRTLVKILLILIPLLSITLSFFSLPLEIAVVVSIMFAIVPFILDRFLFIYNVVHIMPMPTEGMLSHIMGSSWFSKDTGTMDGLGFVIIFKYKETAKEAFSMFKAWNYGKVIDASENIAFRAISEGDCKYSIFVFPGDRIGSLRHSESLAKNTYGTASCVTLSVVKFHMQFCFDYSNEELKMKCINSMPHVSELILNVGYIENNGIKFYSKRGFRLRNFTLRDRSDDQIGSIEKSLTWDDPTGKLPEINQSLVDKVNESLHKET